MGVGLRQIGRAAAQALVWANWLRLPGQAARALVASALSERARWPLWLPVALGGGIGLYFALPFEPGRAAAIAAGALSVASAILATRSWTPTSLRVVLALLSATALGFAVAKLREDAVAAPILTERLGPIPLDGRVEFAEPHGKGIRIVLADPASPRFAGGTTPKRLRISFRAGAGQLVPGDRIHAMAVLMPPPAPASPDAYDFARTAFFDGLGAVGYAYGRPRVVERWKPSGLYDRALMAIADLRWRMTLRIRRELPGSDGAIAAAIITGERGGISDNDEQALRDAGLAHVLAIAGLHMALVGLGLFWVVRAALAAWPAVALRYPIKKWAAAAALCGALFYLVVSGAAPPTIRAFTMLAMMLTAILVDRPALSMRSVALAATIILLAEPESLIAPGFQMSFSAVVSLIAVAEWEQVRALANSPLGPKRFAHARRYIRGIATTSLVGSIATLPYAAFHFDRTTHYAVLGNLLAMPIMGFVTMPAAAIAVVLMPLGLDGVPLHVMGWGIEAMLAIGRFVSHLPGAVSIVSAWPVGALVAISFGGLWCAIWRRRWRWLGLLPVAVGTALVLYAPAPAILIDADAQTIALRGHDGLLRLIRPALDGYAADEWLKRDGDERTADVAVAVPSDGVRCDAEGCIARLPDGETLAAVQRAEALAEDCARADIVISAVPAHGFCSPPKIVIDASDASASGGFAISLSPAPAAQSVSAARGARPWNPSQR